MTGEFDYRIYWNERLRGNFGLESVGYLGLGRHFNTWMYRLRKAVFLRSVRKLKVEPANAAVLDVGSGSGFYISLWKKLNVKSITGVDISTQAIQNLRARHPDAQLFEVDITEETFPVRQYDIISCMDVLFHVVDDKRFERAISNLSRSLVKGGHLIISDNFLHGEPVRYQHHVSRSLESYRVILEAAGLKIISRRPGFYFLNFPVDSTSRLLHFVWKLFLKFIPGREPLGFLAGLLFYPLDLLVVSLLREGPSTEILICEKR